MKFQVTTTADCKLSYTPCYKYVKQKLYNMKIDEHKLWDTMNNLNFIKEYLKENLIEELPNSFWKLLDKSITDVETIVKTESNS